MGINDEKGKKSIWTYPTPRLDISDLRLDISGPAVLTI
jgi:hypothetical protein